METSRQFRRLLLASIVTLVILTGMLIPRTQAASILSPDDVISVERFLNDEDFMYRADIQAFLEAHSSPLAHYSVHFSLSNTDDSAANIIAGAALSYNLNPRVLLALIETQSKLITLRPDDLNALKYPFGRHSDLPTGFAAQVWTVAESLNRNYVTFAVESASLQAGAETEVEVNAATWALQETLAGDITSFERVYTSLFEQTPTATLPQLAQAASTVGLTSPYDGAFDDPEEITALFDHEYPTYENGSYLTHWSGECRPGATFSTCVNGYSCYTGHDAYDYGIPAWSNIYASADGTVVFVGTDCAGMKVIVEHAGGLRTAYWHLRDPLVDENDVVARGQLIGLSGGDQGGCSTGAHLHFNVTLDNMDIDPFGWEGDYAEPCVLNDTCAPGQYLWITGTLTSTVTPTPTVTVTPSITPTPSATSTPDPDADMYEPDNEPNAATALRIYPPQEHNIVPVGDHDWMSFTVETASAVNLWTNGLSNDDTEIFLYDAGLNLIESNADSGSGATYSYIDRTCDVDPLPAGLYYVRVTEEDDTATIGSYYLQFTSSVCTTTPVPTPSVMMPQMFIPLVMQGN